MGRKIAICIDSSENSLVACRWARDVIVRDQDEVHLLSVEYIIPTGMTPMPPLMTAGSMTAVARNYEESVREEASRVSILLQTVSKDVFGATRKVHVHALEPCGGASGVAQSIVVWCETRGVDMVIMGTRGMGSAKSALMSLVGLGSVSSYCAHNLKIPVCVVHHEVDEKKSDVTVVAGKRKVLVCVDDSDESLHALEWTVGHVMREEDELHLVSVALPVPYDIVEEDASAAHVLTSQEQSEAHKNAMDCALKEVASACDRASELKVKPENIFCKALEPEGGASDIAVSIQHYTQKNGIHVVALGSRGMGSMKRAMMSFVGLGSVSDWCVQHMKTPVVVIPMPKDGDVKHDD